MIFCRVEQVSDRRHHISCPRSIHSEFRSREWNGRRLNNKKKKTSNKIMRSSWKTIFLWIHWVLWCINKNLGYQAILHRIHFLLPQIAIFHVFRAHTSPNLAPASRTLASTDFNEKKTHYWIFHCSLDKFLRLHELHSGEHWIFFLFSFFQLPMSEWRIYVHHSNIDLVRESMPEK